MPSRTRLFIDEISYCQSFQGEGRWVRELLCLKVPANESIFDGWRILNKIVRKVELNHWAAKPLQV